MRLARLKLSRHVLRRILTTRKCLNGSVRRLPRWMTGKHGTLRGRVTLKKCESVPTYYKTRVLVTH